jgi:cysteine desulfurase / selenocysteine lyase
LRRIYFDNAATSFPKPESVYAAVDYYSRHIGASAGRGAYREAQAAGEIIYQTRRGIARLLNASDPLSIIMTFNCTDGLSLCIKGLLRDGGDHVVTTCMEHNSVLRPLNALAEQLGIEVTYVPADSQGLIDPADIGKAIKKNTKLIAVVHGSNVCGSVQDVKAIGKIAAKAGIAYLVDGAQTVGSVVIDVQDIGADMLAFPGHKGLLGPLGTGGLYIRPGFEKKIVPLKEGGTGSKSEVPMQPDFMPDRFESGSHNNIGIAGLKAGVEYLLDRGVARVAAHERQLCRVFLERTADVPGLTVYGPGDVDKRIGVFSVSVEGYEPAELAAVLESESGLLTRPGLHCAPLAHKAIGSFELGGTTRFSFGPFITTEDVEYAAEQLAVISEQLSVKMDSCFRRNDK